MKQQLDSKAVVVFFLGFSLRGLSFLGFLAWGLSMFSIEVNGDPFRLMGWLGILVPVVLIAAFVWARLTYQFYRYEITNDSFRKEIGVIWKKYVTIPYDRIQNIDIYRGVVARVLGLSDIQIQTAGASAQYSRYGALGLGAEGRLPALSRESAEKLRDELVRRAQRSKNQGL